MKAEFVLFAVFAVASIASALGVVMLRNPVKSALSLIVCFFSLASLYIIQHAELIGVLQVLVYAGAIMVLFVFVIMLVENKEEAVVAPSLAQRVAIPFKVLAVSLVATSVMMLILKSGPWTLEALPNDFGSPASVGKTFFDQHLLQFELTSLLLLVGIVGAVVVAKRGR
ncbi:MAG: NADH-quinone oxidoreductase subunit J [Deltaproteobacteria bacterium]|nr:NADH-quinone oxidoreductase subunit J [Deltaproteobacteria bacterium]